jgi:hypothetical protein
VACGVGGWCVRSKLTSYEPASCRKDKSKHRIALHGWSDGAWTWSFAPAIARRMGVEAFEHVVNGSRPDWRLHVLCIRSKGTHVLEEECRVRFIIGR